MIPRVVTFVGNCQAEAFARFYREFCIDDDEADVEFIDIAALNENNFARPGSLRRLRATRILVEQVFDWPRPLDDHIGPACERFTFPTATLWFLWPHTGVPHPRNEDASVPGAPVSPPYPAEYGDGFLNRLIKAEMPPAVAVHRYLELDIVKRTNLPSRFEKEMDLIGRRDSQPRIGLRDEISAPFPR
ncbi:MAG: WcbI family polysaccharide biosynthesis putative acetyltransferase [Rhodospirillales bacterium]